MDILPFLHNENKNVISKFNKFSKLIIEYDNFLKKEMIKLKQDVYFDNYLLIDKFLKLDNLLQKSILEDILYNIYIDDIYLLNDKHVSLIYSLINSSKTNSYIELPKNIKIIKEYNKLYFNKTNIIETIDNVEFNDYYEDDYCILKKVNENYDFSNNSIRLNSIEIKSPLYLVNRKNGMKMNLKNGHKKINDIFTDSKVSKEKRDRLPILIDSNGEVLWLPGIKKSKFAKDKTEKCDIIIEYYLKGGN